MNAAEREILAQLTGQIEPWKQFLLDNPDAFILHYFPHRIEALEAFHLELIDASCNHPRSLVLYPAGHGKTTIVSELLTIYELCRDPNVRQIILTKNDAEAENIMRSIQTELAENEELIEDFGPFTDASDKTKPWSLSAMTVAKRTRVHKSPTVSCFGWRAKQVLGMRVDRTVCDDVVTTENSASPVMREKMRTKFDNEVQTGPEHPDSRLTVVGTLFHPEDLYSDLMEIADPEDGQGLWLVRQFSAIVDEEARTTLWPERWPFKRLMIQKATMGTLEFNKRYRNIAVDPSSLLFKEQYVKGGYIGKVKYPGCLDRTHTVGQFDPTWRIVAGFDPAVGLTRSAKFCAHIAVAVGACRDHEKCLWIVDLDRDQWTLPQQVRRILDWHERYGLVSSSVEANSYQGGLLQAVQEKMEERGQVYRVEPHYTTRTNKPDPDVGLERLSPWFEQGKVHIPWGDVTSRRKMDKLVDELVAYPGRTTDTVMALWFAWLKLETSGPRYQSFSRLSKPMAWQQRRSGRRIVQNPYYARET